MKPCPLMARRLAGERSSWVVENARGEYLAVLPPTVHRAAQVALQFAASADMKAALPDAADELERAARLAPDPDSRERYRVAAERCRAALRRCLTNDPADVLRMPLPAVVGPDGAA